VRSIRPSAVLDDRHSSPRTHIPHEEHPPRRPARGPVPGSATTAVTGAPSHRGAYSRDTFTSCRPQPPAATLTGAVSPAQVSIGGRPNLPRILLSVNRVTAEMRAPESVRTIIPCAPNAGEDGSCR